jgi:hypothetical protein
MDAEQAESFETIYDQLEELRRHRDAAGRLCARALIAKDMDGAQWQAASFQSYADQVDSLRDQIAQAATDRK